MNPKILSFSVLFLTALTTFSQSLTPPNWDELHKTKPWEVTELYREITFVTPGKEGGPPSDATVLFDGTNLDKWQTAQFGSPVDMKGFAEMIPLLGSKYVGSAAPWRIEKGEVVVEPGKGAIATRVPFGDVQLHIEWLAPTAQGKSSQGYSNSGVIFMGMYEVQILNSYENPTYNNGQASSVYKQHIPMVNASLPPDNWQVYDIVFIAPKFSEKGTMVNPARITVFHNGVLTQNNVELLGPTCFIGTPFYIKHPPKLPLVLQDHGDPIRFRNIWIREI